MRYQFCEIIFLNVFLFNDLDEEISKNQKLHKTFHLSHALNNGYS